MAAFVGKRVILCGTLKGLTRREKRRNYLCGTKGRGGQSYQKKGRSSFSRPLIKLSRRRVHIGPRKKKGRGELSDRTWLGEGGRQTEGG